MSFNLPENVLIFNVACTLQYYVVIALLCLQEALILGAVGRPGHPLPVHRVPDHEHGGQPACDCRARPARVSHLHPL